jgi:hypothetical protein
MVVALATAATAAGAAAAPGPDPRLEVALSTNLISQIERSVQFEKTLQQTAKPPKPAVDPGEMVKVHEDVYLDRKLAPQQGPASGEGAVRVFRRDER